MGEFNMVEKGSKSVKNYEITREVINLAELSICENVLEYSVQQEMMGMAYRARDLHASITGSNDKCWRGYVEYKNGLDELVKVFTATVKRLILDYQADYPGTVIDFEPDVNKMGVMHWTNINEPGSMNDLHVHNDADFSAVYYLQGEGTGRLKFCDLSLLPGSCGGRTPFSGGTGKDPIDNALFVFPASVPHSVALNESDKDRVCIAMNLRLNQREPSKV